LSIFYQKCYGRIISVLCVKIICGQRGVEGEIEREADISHLRFLRKGGGKVAERKCHYCGRGFIPDPRVGNRQKACSVACQRLRKRENNRAFRDKNPKYWCAPERYAYLKEWRRQHPDYQMRWREAMGLLGIGRSRLHQLRRGWLLSSRKRPFRLWQRVENAFHVISPEVEQWLDRELRYIRQEAETFRGKFNFAFLAEEAQKRFDRPFSRNSFRLYALKKGYYHALPEEKGKVYTRFETSGPGALFQHDSSFHLWLPSAARKHYLILTKDDHSRRVVGTRLVEVETSFEHLQTVRQTVTVYGIPLAYYLDNHSIFRFVLHQGVHVRYKLHEDEGEIQFRRALGSLDIGMIYTGKRQAQAKEKVEKIFDYLQRRLPYLCEKHKVKDCVEAQKILDDLVSYYNDQRIHEETREIPTKRWQQANPSGQR
jgi:hypothetical protein